MVERIQQWVDLGTEGCLRDLECSWTDMWPSALRKHRQDIMDFKTDFKKIAIFYQQTESQCEEGGKKYLAQFPKRNHAIWKTASQWVREGIEEEGRASRPEQSGLGGGSLGG